jgi:lantibiotic biosynthesis protein
VRSNRWKPLALPGSRFYVDVHDVIVAIARDLVDEACKPAPRRRWNCQPHELVVLLAYLTLSDVEGDYVERTELVLREGQEEFTDSEPRLCSTSSTQRSAVFGEMSRAGWVACHLSNFAAGADAEVGDRVDWTGRSVDGRILHSLKTVGGGMPFHLLGGLVGVGLYLLECLPSKSAGDALALVLDYLEGSAERTQCGLAWRTVPENLSDGERPYFPDGKVDLSVPYGSSGVAGFLDAMCVARAHVDRAEYLLSGALNWLLANQCQVGSVPRFWLSVPDPLELSTGFGWCYPDLGILLVLLRSAQRTGRRDWLGMAQSLSEHCLRWPSEFSGVADASILSGASGIGHAFNRLYQQSGDGRFLKASLQWFEYALSMRSEGAGIGGFISRGHHNDQLSRGGAASLLTGAIGTALALLGTISEIEPDWDRMMLFSGPRM